MAWKNNPTPECVVDGTECDDDWVWDLFIYLFIWYNILPYLKDICKL